MKKEYLNHAIIELTTECNLRCEHCYNWWKQTGKQAERFNSYRKAFALLDHLIRKTMVKRVVFTGGEPTISERFIELVLHAKVNGVKVTVITNGNGPLSVYDQLAALKVDLMEFSVLSFRPEIHDRITGVEGSWERMMTAMKFMLEQGREGVPVIVITKTNYAYVRECVEELSHMGLRRFMINRYNIGGEGLNHGESLSVDRDALREVFHDIDTLVGQRELDVVSGVCTPHCLLDPGDYPHICFGNCSFDVYRRPLTFDIVGNVRLCNHSPVIAGNVYHQELSEILFSDYTTSWEETRVEACKECRKWEACHGGCRAAAEQLGGSLKDVDPVVKEQMLEPFI